LFYVFLPDYLASRGASTGQSGAYYTWRNYMLSSVTGIFGPIVAGYMCNLKVLGRKYTMAIGALITMAFFFAYTAVRTPEQNVAFSCIIAFTLNIYYGTCKSNDIVCFAVELLLTPCVTQCTPIPQRFVFAAKTSLSKLTES
jgi:hypothetical protein